MAEWGSRTEAHDVKLRRKPKLTPHQQKERHVAENHPNDAPIGAGAVTPPFAL